MASLWEVPMTTATAVLGVTADRWDHMGGWGGGWMWLWGVAMMVLFVVVIVWLVRAVAGPAGQTGPGTPLPRDPTERAREILAERYARGELSTEEYRERVDALQ
jgi:putative membrane protein